MRTRHHVAAALLVSLSYVFLTASCLLGPPAHRAALYAAEAANEVVDPLLDSRPTWEGMGVEYCHELRDKLEETLNLLNPGLGARVLLDQ
jgi:hypothetical protein